MQELPRGEDQRKERQRQYASAGNWTIGGAEHAEWEVMHAKLFQQPLRQRDDGMVAHHPIQIRQHERPRPCTWCPSVARRHLRCILQVTLWGHPHVKDGDF